MARERPDREGVPVLFGRIGAGRADGGLRHIALFHVVIAEMQVGLGMVEVPVSRDAFSSETRSEVDPATGAS